MPDLQPMTIWAATPETPLLLNAVADERVRQVEKWGVQTRPDGTSEELTHFAEVAKQNTDEDAADGSLTWLTILEEEVAEAACETDPDALRAELIQVAAVALSWAEDLDRKAAR